MLVASLKPEPMPSTTTLAPLFFTELAAQTPPSTSAVSTVEPVVPESGATCELIVGLPSVMTTTTSAPTLATW